MFAGGHFAVEELRLEYKHNNKYVVEFRIRKLSDPDVNDVIADSCKHRIPHRLSE